MPTEKDVQYYSDLVQREVADKSLSFGCKVRHMWDEQKYLTLFDWDLWVIIENKWVNNFTVQYQWRYWSPTLLNCNTNNNEILWHEIRPHHLLLRFNNNWNTEVYIDCNGIQIWYWESDVIISRDHSKPFSWQSDDTKIELGKIVEEVLSSKIK